MHDNFPVHFDNICEEYDPMLTPSCKNSPKSAYLNFGPMSNLSFSENLVDVFCEALETTLPSVSHRVVSLRCDEACSIQSPILRRSHMPYILILLHKIGIFQS